MKYEKKNLDIRNYAKLKNVTMTEIARSLGIAVCTLSNTMRKEFNDNQKAVIYAHIDEIAYKKETEVDT